MSVESVLVSIVTVVLNNQAGLTATAESIRRQANRDYEWIVVDGGSRDGSADVPKNSGILNVKCISEPDHGIYDAMNKGIKMATGKYILFLNAGDILSESTVIEDVAYHDRLITHERRCAPVIMGNVNLVFPSGQRIYKTPRGAEYIWHSLPASHQSMLFPSDFLKDNLYDTSYRICGDYYIASVAYKAGRKFVTVDFPIANFAVGGYSYQHPLILMREAVRIQRVVLKLDYPRILLSALRRLITMLGVGVLAKLEGRWLGSCTSP